MWEQGEGRKNGKAKRTEQITNVDDDSALDRMGRVVLARVWILDFEAVYVALEEES